MSIVIFHQLSGIDPCEKHIIIPVGHAKQHFFMVRSKLEAKAIYVVKQACGHDITVEDGQKINKTCLGEYKVITPEQQFLGIFLCIFMYLKWPWLLRFFAKML